RHDVGETTHLAYGHVLGEALPDVREQGPPPRLRHDAVVRSGVGRAGPEPAQGGPVPRGVVLAVALGEGAGQRGDVPESPPIAGAPAHRGEIGVISRRHLLLPLLILEGTIREDPLVELVLDRLVVRALPQRVRATEPRHLHGCAPFSRPSRGSAEWTEEFAPRRNPPGFSSATREGNFDTSAQRARIM